MAPHQANWLFGWWWILSSFATGAVLGLYFHRRDFMGGYDSFRRRLARLGHIAQAALGMMNVLFGLSPLPLPGSDGAQFASAAFIVGAVAMPAVCFLSAWREWFRHLFFIPVLSLASAVFVTAISKGDLP